MYPSHRLKEVMSARYRYRELDGDESAPSCALEMAIDQHCTVRQGGGHVDGTRRRLTQSQIRHSFRPTRPRRLSTRSGRASGSSRPMRIRILTTSSTTNLLTVLARSGRTSTPAGCLSRATSPFSELSSGLSTCSSTRNPSRVPLTRSTAPSSTDGRLRSTS